ncbi:MAG: chorismate-binding protein [Bacteroidota bacterium]
MMELKADLERCWEKGLPFAAFSLPSERNIHLWVQADDRNSEIQAGFLMHPFSSHGRSQAVWIQADGQRNIKQNPEFSAWLKALPSFSRPFSLPPPEMNAATHQALVGETVAQIQAGTFEKAIISRPKLVAIPENWSLMDYFFTLQATYPKAHVALVYHPQVGIWIGASPEILLTGTEQHYETVALAGTRRWNQGKLDQPWRSKELDEQKIVADYLFNRLEDLGAKHMKHEGPKTIQAGQLAHLKTQFSFEFAGDPLRIAEELHPTPAVSGFPKAAAIEYLELKEPYDRSYYAGFMGPITGEKTHLWVNLRCMQVFDSQLAIYVGGGITAASNPGEEWEETEWKSRTLLTVLEHMPKLDLKLPHDFR